MAKPVAFLLFLLMQHVFAHVASAEENLFTLASAEHSSVEKFKSALDALPPGEVSKIRDADGRTLLHWAVAASQQVRTSELLFVNADVNAKDNRGRTPLFECIDAHDPDWKGEADMMTLEMLVYRGTDVNMRANDGTTPLALAAEKGDTRKAEFLVWRGAELNPAGVAQNKVPLSIALKNRDQRMITLLETAAKLDAEQPGAAVVSASKTKSDSRRLADILTAADLNAIEAKLADGWNINEQDENGRTALFRAVDTCRPDLASLLIFEGADPNIATKTGKTPLVASVRFLNIEGQRMTVMLLLAGADVHATMKNGETALTNAVAAGHEFGIEWLVWRGADPLAPTPKGSLMEYATHPPVAWMLRQMGVTEKKETEPEAAPETNPVVQMIDAARRGDLDAVKLALESGVPVDAPRGKNDFQTALNGAAFNGHFETVDLLLQHGANINRQLPVSGWHPLHGLAGLGRAGTENDTNFAVTNIEKLLARGANPDIQMKDSTTPLMIAAKEGVTANAEVLLKAGAHINLRNREGLTALGIAQKYGRAEMVALLQARGGVE